jgi:hypothetical protein
VGVFDKHCGFAAHCSEVSVPVHLKHMACSDSRTLVRIHSCTYSLVCVFTRMRIHSCMYSLVCVFTRVRIHSYAYSLVCMFTRVRIHSCAYSLVCSGNDDTERLLGQQSGF